MHKSSEFAAEDPRKANKEKAALRMTNLIMEMERGRVKIGKVRVLFLRWHRLSRKVEEENGTEGIFIGGNAKVSAYLLIY